MREYNTELDIGWTVEVTGTVVPGYLETHGLGFGLGERIPDEVEDLYVTLNGEDITEFLTDSQIRECEDCLINEAIDGAPL